MPVYFCRISNEKGRIEEFLRESASEETCLRELNEKNPYVLSIRELPPSSAGARPRRFSRRLIQELTELMALTLSSGLSLKDSLDVSQTVFTRGEGNALVTLLRQRLNKGSTFTEALESAGTGFPPFYMGMVRIGERIGSLEQVTSRLSKHLREEKVLRDRFSSALIYPAIVLGIAVSSAVFIVAVLFPRLREIFNEMGSNAAGNMESLMGGLTTVFAVLGVVAALALVLVIGIVIARRKGGGLAVRIDRLFLGIPLYSRFMMQRELMNFSFAMEALTAAGVGVEEALTEGAGTVSNRALQAELRSVRERVLKGERLSAAFAHSPLIPERVSRWMSIGERIGHVEKVFGQLRGYYQQEVEKWIDRLMALIEPALIVGLGILIMAFVVFFIIPVFSLYGALM